MSQNLESLPKKENWAEYIDVMANLVDGGDWNQLESHLSDAHPVLPGEREAFIALEENLGRLPLVQLDNSGYHVIPRQ